MSQWYNRKVRPATFAVGDKVRIFNDSSKPGRCPEWQHFYQDLGTIVQRINDVRYVVSCPSWRSHRIVHVDKLKIEKPSLNKIIVTDANCCNTDGVMQFRLSME